MKNWIRQFLKKYSFLSVVANLLVAISVSGLGVLGVLSSSVALPIVMTSACILGVIGVVGRFLDESYDELREEENDK